MDACLNCPYRVHCVFDPSFPCFLDNPEIIKLKYPFDYGYKNPDRDN